MRFFADRAIAHRAGFEALHNGFDGFDLFDGDRRFGPSKIKQAAKGAKIIRLFVNERRVIFEYLIATGPAGELELMDGLRIEQMIFTFRAPLILAADFKCVAIDLAGRESNAMPSHGLLSKHFETDTADPRRGPGEILIDDFVVQTNRLEDLRAAITLNCGDAHFGHRLDHALDGGLHIFMDSFAVIDVRQQLLPDHVFERFENEIRIDRAAAVANQEREMMHFARLAGFENETDARARALADHMMMEARCGEHRRDRGAILIDPAIGKDDYIHAIGDGAIGGGEEIVERAIQRTGRVKPSVSLKENRQSDRFKAGALNMPEFLQFLISEDRVLQLDHAATLRRWFNQIAFGADHRVRGRDDFLADRVNRRVRDLREELLEIIID